MHVLYSSKRRLSNLKKQGFWALWTTWKTKYHTVFLGSFSFRPVFPADWEDFAPDFCAECKNFWLQTCYKGFKPVFYAWNMPFIHKKRDAGPSKNGLSPDFSNELLKSVLSHPGSFPGEYFQPNRLFLWIVSSIVDDFFPHFSTTFPRIWKKACFPYIGRSFPRRIPQTSIPALCGLRQLPRCLPQRTPFYEKSFSAYFLEKW